MAQLPGNLDRETHPVEFSDQQIQNQSFDRDFNLAARLMAAYHAASDTIKRVCVDSIGRLKIIVEGFTPATSILDHQSTATVAANTVTTVLTRTIVTKELLLDSIIATGTLDAEFRVVIDSTTQIVYCTAEQDRTMKLEFPIPQKIAVGSTIDIKVIHYHASPSLTGDFFATLIGHKD